VRALLFRCKKGNWQALTGAGLLDLLFGLLGFGQIKHRLNDVFKGTPSEKKISQDDLPALAYFSKIFTLHVFLSNLPSKKGRSNVTYPVELGLMLCKWREFDNFLNEDRVLEENNANISTVERTHQQTKGQKILN
jgi:hypothetical protein